MTNNRVITHPDDARLDELCDQLAELAPQLDGLDAWPAHQLALCADYGVYQWFIPSEYGGQQWDDRAIVKGYLRLSAACLTTTFVITQRMGACRRIAENDQNESLRKQLLPDLISGNKFATVAISHLTTSRRHMTRPVLRAEETAEGFVLDGYSPWVTGSPYADVIVTGATMEDGRQLLLAVPTDLPGIETPAAPHLVGLSASQTGPLNCNRVAVSRDWLLAAPTENVMQQGVGARSGGLQTSTLAAGLTSAAISFIETEAAKRPDLSSPGLALRREWESLIDDLLSAAGGNPVCTNEQLRTRANSLVLRATQASMTAAKGAGYVVGHPAGRWCREALFFLVWSCPPPVATANLCELAGLV